MKRKKKNGCCGKKKGKERKRGRERVRKEKTLEKKMTDTNRIVLLARIPRLANGTTPTTRRGKWRSVS
jgi:hypothetical protein